MTASGRQFPLLVALAVLFVLYPLVLELGHAQFFRFVFIGVLVSAAYTVGQSRRHLLIAALLGVPVAVSQVAAYSWPNSAASLISALLTVLFLLFICGVVLRSVLKPGRVTADRIAGAISVFLLLGLLWAMFYGILVMLDPNAFRLPDDLAFRPYVDSSEYSFVYFSFVTLTTLGYGDITPTTPTSQALTWMEAVTGQLFLAILIARLVSLQIIHRDSESD